jgi:ABC-type glutathione transport system ATPase component
VELLYASALRTLAFVLTGVAVGAVLGIFLFGILLSLDRIHLGQNRRLAMVSSATDILVTTLESFPSLVVLLALSALLPSWSAHPWRKLLVMAGLVGLFWSASFARFVAARAAQEFSRNYPTQLVMMGLAPIRQVLVQTILVGQSLRQLGVLFLNALTYGLVVDSGMGCILQFSTALRNAAIYYYKSSLGEFLAKAWYGYHSRSMTDVDVQPAYLWPALLLIVGTVFLLAWLSQILSTPDKASRGEVGWQQSDDRSLVLGIRKLGARLGWPSRFRLTVADDEFRNRDVAWVSGPSGSGKSLFFKTLIEMHPDGSAVAGNRTGPGQSIHEQTELVFQEPAMYLYPYSRVRTILERFGGEDVVRKMAQDPEKARLLDNFVKHCSAGEKRLIANGLLKERLRHLRPIVPGEVARKRLLLCDEPDASLDPRNKRRWLGDLEQVLAQQPELALLYVSHDPEVGHFLKNSLRGRFRYLTAREGVIREDVLSASAFEVARPNPISRTSDGEPVLIVRNLTVPGILKDEESKQPLLHRFSMDVRKGERAAILGPNGAGKSTLLKAMMNLIPRRFEDDGEPGGFWLRLKGGMEEATEWPYSRISNKVSFLYDDNEQSFPAAVRLDRIARWYCHRNHVSRTLLVQRIRDCGLDEGALSRFPLELSGGQRQLLAFAFATCNPAKGILLFDEPFSRLDEKNQDRLIELIKEDSNRTYVFITHVGATLDRLYCSHRFVNSDIHSYFGPV